MLYRSYRYAKWDGTQNIFELDASDLMDHISDELLKRGDIMSALRDMFRNGMPLDGEERTTGLKDLIERVRNQRREELQRHNLDSIVDDFKNKLDEILVIERATIEQQYEKLLGEAERPDELGVAETKSLQDMMRDRLDRNKKKLDELGDSVSGQIQNLMEYDFVNPEAQQKFQELLDMLKGQMANNISAQMRDQMSNMSAEQSQRMKDMISSLIEMIRDKSTGCDPDFNSFMEKFGDMFGPDQPDSFEELMDLLHEQLAQMQSMMNSMSPDARSQLESALNAALDPEMQSMMNELARLMEQFMPMDDLRRQYPFVGEDSLSMDAALDLMSHLQELDKLEQSLQDASKSGYLDNIDSTKLAELLGESAKDSFDEMNQMLNMLKEAGYLTGDDKIELTAKGMRKIGQKALKEVFVNLKKDRLGGHETNLRGAGGDLVGDTKQYEFGDPFQIDMQSSIKNAILRTGPSVPVSLKPDDFEVYREEHTSRASTVVLLDQSRSMGLYNNFQAAKKVTLALLALIRMQYPRDSMHIVGFSLYAHEIAEEELPTASWNAWDSGTNLHHGLILARKLLSKEKGSTRQILLITDGEPTAHIENGQAYFNYPPSYRTELETLRQVRQCTQEGIIINTFMLENNYQLVDFVDNMTRINRGRAFYSSSSDLGQYVLVDYLSNRRKRLIA
ncbi:MAG: VWA domain-containing protein [Chloroflexota bacterium]|nr:VWA domain-containing protein [Chloroflexota bacterium]